MLTQLAAWLQTTPIRRDLLKIPSVAFDRVDGDDTAWVETVIKYATAEWRIDDVIRSFSRTGKMEDVKRCFDGFLELEENRDQLLASVRDDWRQWYAESRNTLANHLRRYDESPEADRRELPESVELFEMIRSYWDDFESSGATERQDLALEVMVTVSKKMSDHVERSKNAIARLNEVRESRTVEVSTLKSEIQKRLTELLFDPDLLEENRNGLTSVPKVIVELMASRDIDKLKQWREALKRFVPGAVSHLPDSKPETPNEPEIPKAPLSRSVAVNRTPTLSFVAETEINETLKRPPSTRNPVSDADKKTIEDIWSWPWDRRELDKLQAATTVSDGHMPTLDRRAFLQAAARIRLIKREWDEAQLLFLDACAEAIEREREPEDLRWTETAVWGVLLAVLGSVWSAEESETLERVMAPGNLTLLFRRPIGKLPLLNIEQVHQMMALGQTVALAQDAHAVLLYKRYLARTLTPLPRAVQEFAGGVTLAMKRNPVSAVQLLAGILREEGTRLDQEKQSEVVEKARSIEALDTKSRVGTTKDLIREVREWLEPLEEDSETVGHILGKLSDVESDTNPDSERLVTTKLLFRDLALATGDTPTLIFRISPASDQTTISRLRSRVWSISKNLVNEPHETRFPLLVWRPWMEGIDGVDWVVRETGMINNEGEHEVRVEHMIFSDHGIWNDATGQGRASAYSVSRKRQDPNWPPNPYSVGQVTPEGGFFGREKDLEKIKAGLGGKNLSRCVILLGDRRVGKTSLLQELLRDSSVAREYVGAMVDLQYFHWGSKEVGLYRDHVIPCIRSQLEKQGIDSGGFIVDETETPSAIHQYFVNWMLKLDDRLRSYPWKLLVVLDELEKIIVNERGERQTQANEVFAALRSVSQQCQRIGFVLSGVSDIVQPRLSKKSDRLWGLGTTIRLEMLDEDAVEELVKKPARSVYELTSLARKRIWVETSGHPYLVQAVCFAIFEFAKSRRYRYLGESDVITVLRSEAERKTNWFRHFLDALSDPMDMAMIGALSRLQLGGRYVGLDAWYRAMAREWRPAGTDELRTLADNLEQRLGTLIQRNPSHLKRYRIRIPIFASYLRSQMREVPSLVVKHS